MCCLPAKFGDDMSSGFVLTYTRAHTYRVDKRSTAVTIRRPE